MANQTGSGSSNPAKFSGKPESKGGQGKIISGPKMPSGSKPNWNSKMPNNISSDKNGAYPY